MNIVPEVERQKATALLRALLVAHRANPAPELADAIAHVSKVVDRYVAPLGAVGARKAYEAWLARAAHGDPADLELLLRDLFDGPGAFIRAKLVALEAFDTDPRIATAVVAHVVGSTYYVGTPVGTALFKALERHGDARIVAAIRASSFLSPDDDTDLGWRTKKLEALAKAVAKRKVTPLGEAARTQLAQAMALGGATTAGEVSFASAKDEPARAVATDQLLEEGGPRGEFVVLQRAKKLRPLTAAEAKREATLLAAHAKRWMGKVAKVLEPKNAVFEDGVLVGGELEYGADQVLDAPEWSTVRWIAASGGVEEVLALVRRWPTIEHVRVVGALDFAALAHADPPLGLRSVAYSGPDRAPSPAEREALLGAPGLPALEELGITGYWHEPAAIAWILEGPLAHRLRRLTYDSKSLAVAAWATLMAGAPPTLERGRICRRGAWVDVTRDAEGRMTHARIGFDPPVEGVRKSFEKLLAVLEALPPGTFRRVEVDGALVAPTKALRAQLDAAVARLSSPG